MAIREVFIYGPDGLVRALSDHARKLASVHDKNIKLVTDKLKEHGKQFDLIKKAFAQDAPEAELAKVAKILATLPNEALAEFAVNLIQEANISENISTGMMAAWKSVSDELATYREGKESSTTNELN